MLEIDLKVQQRVMSTFDMLLVLGCNNGIGGFHKKLVTFRDPTLPDFCGLKRCASKNPVLIYNKKAGKFGSVAPKFQMVENLHRIERNWLKIDLIPDFLGYSNSTWTGTNMHTWFYGQNNFWEKVPAFR